jgi:hypothetical protein
MKKCAKVFVSLLLVVGLTGITGALTSCKSSSDAYMNTPKKYKSSKTIKKNYSVRGNNKKNGSTYHSY